MTNRIPVEKFDFPVEKIKSGYYTDAYFLRSEEILNGDNHHPRVLMQIFARDNVVLCGTDEVIALIKKCAFHPENITISPTGFFKCVNDYVLYQKREARVIVVQVTDAKTGEVYYQD